MNPQSKTAYLESNLDSSVRFVAPLNSGSGNVDHMEGAIETSGNNNDNYNPFSSWACLLCHDLGNECVERRREWSLIEFKGNETVRCAKIAFSLGEESHRGSHFVSIETQQTLRKETNYEYFTFGTTFCNLRYSKSLWVAKQFNVMPSEGLTDV